jgi:hypothetical protein
MIRLVPYVCLAMLVAVPASAGPLLTAGYESQLEAWLGSGSLDFTNIYTKKTGDSSVTFHNAVDNRGATVTLFEAIFNGQTYILGGYNPQSWSSSGYYNQTHSDAQRTAFVFNLTVPELRRQKLTTDPLGAYVYGSYQTYNHASYGPTFGGGHDIHINHSLTTGYEYAYSYGPGVQSTGDDGLLPGLYDGSWFTVGAIETYTLAPAQSVPEPSSLLILGAGALGMLVQARRRKKI